ncbi:MAG: uroporphyrinogen-III synthase [Candidatus Rokubacteria bacterium]|nr:uroporphyrinogen-III synthase [Candidatus Rokubacteria bacterium]MBI2491404.1 uroporphyrinogen-III synthase [Candidatus Rokubacteria bacterium]MBI4256017.1 uroporphyrinogen-III synthase [Candidatus Rokubacteria bacterium]
MARVARATGARPLEGRTIVVTRAAAQAQRFVQLLESAGARVMQAPTIVIEPPSSWEPLDQGLDVLESFQWVIFTSVNGVAMVDRRLGARGLAWAAVARRRVAAIGPATADALAEHGVRVQVVPDEYRAEALVERLRPLVAPGDRVLLPRAKETRDVLVVELKRLGAIVAEVPAYQTRRVDDGVGRLREAFAARAIDAVTFTSSSTVRNFAELFSDGERRSWRGRVTVASIGPITAATAAEYGLATDVMPSEYTIPALARAIADYFTRVPRPSGRRPRRSE